MGMLSLLNRRNFNPQTGVVEFKGSTGDSEAVVNQFGIHNHKAGLGNNLVESGADIATMIGGPVGVVANGANAVRHAFKGNWGSALKSVGKGVASMIPGLNLIVGGASLVKDGTDVLRHGAGAMQQGMQGGYQRQSAMASRMFGGNMSYGMGMSYGGNSAMYGGQYGQYGYGGNYGYNPMQQGGQAYGMSPGYW
jgi:hypothetical protein